MKAYDIKLSDLHRILFGEVPMHFFIEVIFRAAVVYLILMISMRLMGKRMSSQLSRNEMAAVASLAAAVGIPLMNPDKGLLQAVLIASIIIFFQWFIARKSAAHKKFESVTQDKVDTLIQDGVLNAKVMVKTRISRERIFAQLRLEQVSQLGMVKSLYFEAGGIFSLLKVKDPKPGLSVLPEWDLELKEDLHSVLNQELCKYCGHNRALNLRIAKEKCINCGHSDWTKAVIAHE